MLISEFAKLNQVNKAIAPIALGARLFLSSGKPQQKKKTG